MHSSQLRDGEWTEAANGSSDRVCRISHRTRRRTRSIENDVVRFPSKPEPYESDAALVRGGPQLHPSLRRSLGDLRAIAAYYVLFSWVYDAFNELPYLRVRGDYGTGKTRFLAIVGSIAYKPIFGSGASTVSPIFHLLEQFGGTLVIDEADFRFSDEKADLVKILNNGNVRGFPGAARDGAQERRDSARAPSMSTGRRSSRAVAPMRTKHWRAASSPRRWAAGRSETTSRSTCRRSTRRKR